MSVIWTATHRPRVAVTRSLSFADLDSEIRRGEEHTGPCSRDPRPWWHPHPQRHPRPWWPAPSPAGAMSRGSGICRLPALPPLGRGPAPLFVCCLVLGCLFFSRLRHGWLCCSSCSPSADMALSSSRALQRVVSERPRAPRDGARPGRPEDAGSLPLLPVLLASSEVPCPPALQDAPGAQRLRTAGPGQQAAGNGKSGRLDSDSRELEPWLCFLVSRARTSTSRL